mmetsp:Transcript_34693/g.136746  ORF Transcript_34693/g.136746 Transcript_34693/m.136746 type:complete len:281 (-) Transcript_34693:109-951(-)
MKCLRVKRCFSTAYHPQSDGQTERINQILETYLRCNSTSTSWATNLPTAELAYNCQVSESTKFSPFELIYGKNPILPSDLHVPDDLDRSLPTPEAATVLLQRQKDQETLARANLRYAQERQRFYYDRGKKDVHFKQGDYVLLSTRNLHLPDSKVFRPRYIGPFKILQKIGEVAYKLELGATFDIHDVFHVSLLRKFNGPEPEDIPETTALLPIHSRREVKSVLGHRRDEKNLDEYFVYFEGETTDDLRWIPYHQLPQNPNTKRQIRYYSNLHKAANSSTG